jgi:2-polyprenyl-6-methoxyphenol hydroxylase-like FAD-dependent oxidoreductase
MEIIVMGAGVGGLAIARTLLAAGHRVRVYERAPGPGRGGAALTIFSNGTAVLNDLGVSLDGAGARIDRLDALTAGGRLRTSMNLAHAADRYGFATKTMSRRRLLERLADGLPGGLVAYGTGCERVAQDDSQATATLSDGSTASGDLLIGADGRHSAVRRCLWGDGAVHPAAFGTWQGLSPIDIDLTRSHRSLMITGRQARADSCPPGKACCSGGSTCAGHLPVSGPPNR